MIRECGMFKFHPRRYLGGVKTFEGLYTIDSVQVIIF